MSDGHLYVCSNCCCLCCSLLLLLPVHLVSNLKFIAETNVKELSPLFSSRSFMFSGLTFKS